MTQASPGDFAAEPMTSETEALRAQLLAGERRALARAITLVESTRPDHRTQARALLTSIHQVADGAIRIGLSGAPGVGKSTFIESFGMKLIERGLRVAVLAVDPSSARTGGSILGDKTRMERLSRQDGAFIRPSPSRAALGGVARRTREAIALCEAVGHDVVIVETVGVGQSETMVADMTDVFALLLAPAGGDALQGVKRGVMEIADLVIVNKADGALIPIASRSQAEYAGALRLMRARPGDPPGVPAAMRVSALTGAGLDEVWEALSSLDHWRRNEGWRAVRRRDQAVKWMRFEIEQGLRDIFAAAPEAAAARDALERAVARGDLPPGIAAERALALFHPAPDGCEA